MEPRADELRPLSQVAATKREASYEEDAEPEEIVLECSRAQYAVAWVMMLLLQVGVCVLLLRIATAYLFIANEPNAFAVLRTLSLPYKPEVTKGVVAIAIILACVHGHAVVRVLWVSFRRHELIVDEDVSPTHPSSPRATQLTNRAIRALLSCWKASAKFQDSFGVRGQNFDISVTIRDIIEVTAQAIQCYQISTTVTTTWVNALFLVSLVLNCWTSAVLRWFLRHNVALFRFSCLAAASVMDLITSIIIPYLVIKSYYRAYKDEDLDYHYDNDWMMRATSELQQVFLTSWLLVITQFLPAWSMLEAVSDMKSLLVVRDTPSVHIERPVREPRWRGRWHRIELMCEIAFIMTGVVAIAAHLQADSSRPNSGGGECLTSLRPWFRTEISCASVLAKQMA